MTSPQGRWGRPTKLTPELQETIVNLVQAGNYVETAARAAGVPHATLHRWLRLADGERQPYRDFRDAVERAKGEAETSLVAVVQSAAHHGSWRAALELLERRFRRWSDRVPASEHGDQVPPIGAEDATAQIIAETDRLAARLFGPGGPPDGTPT